MAEAQSEKQARHLEYYKVAPELQQCEYLSYDMFCIAYDKNKHQVEQMVANGKLTVKHLKGVRSPFLCNWLFRSHFDLGSPMDATEKGGTGTKTSTGPGSNDRRDIQEIAAEALQKFIQTQKD